MRGAIKFFNQAKGYGFIEGQDGKDYFFHFSQQVDIKDNLEKGAAVIFETTNSPKGETAIKVARAK